MGIILNQQQQFIVDKAVDWFRNSSSTLFQFAGYAGTGKSVVLNSIIKRLNLSNDEILPMAYTGQACTIMRKKGLTTACTCHSGLFNQIEEPVIDKYGHTVMDKKFNVPIIRWRTIPKDFSNSKVKLIVLDEAWMIPLSFRRFIDNTGIKVIATGDPGQLPPIADKPGYLVDGNIYYLTELMRQAENSPIVYLANRARNGYPIEPGMYGNDVLVAFDDELDNSILARSNVILCAKNSTRDNINNTVRRDILNITTDYPVLGERLICRKNDWGKEVDGIPLVNGLTGTVVTPPDIGRFNGDVFKLDFLPDLLNAPFISVDVNYKYLNATHTEKKSLNANPYLTGERFEYAYASTVHLSQGSEYYCGIYIEEHLRSDSNNALNYTAITRFKNQMVYIKKRPRFYF